MFAKERQDKIYEMICKNGAVMTAQLVEIFGVSTETVRRDLLFMEKSGQLSKVHGGAVAKTDMKPYLNLNERNREYSDEKRELSLNAMKFIKEGDVIGIDSGSTAISFSETVKESFSSMTVVTHSVDVFEILCNHKEFSVIFCGGNFLRTERAFYGELCLDTLKKLHMQKAFIFPSAVSLENGICDYQPEMFQIQRQLINSSDEIYILADSSKFEKNALLKLSDMNPEYNYVTDSSLSLELKKLYEENGIKIFA